MGWLQRAVEQALGLDTPVNNYPRMIEPTAPQSAGSTYIPDHLASGYDAGHELYAAMKRMERNEVEAKRLNAVQREVHHISETERIETETHVQLEQGFFSTEWRS